MADENVRFTSFLSIEIRQNLTANPFISYHCHRWP